MLLNLDREGFHYRSYPLHIHKVIKQKALLVCYGNTLKLNIIPASTRIGHFYPER